MYRPVSPQREPTRRKERTDDAKLRRSTNWESRLHSIVDTSAAVFARRGYHATGIAELCVANELGKGALYHYIGSKEALLAAIHDRVMDEVLASAERVAAAGGSPTKQLTMLGDQLLDIIARYPDHVWVFLHEFPALTGERAEQFRGRRREFERAGRDHSRSRHCRRRVPPGRAPAHRAGMARHAQLHLPLDQPRRRLTAHDVANRFADIFVAGISARS